MIARGCIASLATTGIPVDGAFECGGIEPESERQFTVKRELRLVSEGRVRVMAAACPEKKSKVSRRISGVLRSSPVDPQKKPNKAPEPTPGLVTPRAMESAFDMKRRTRNCDAARGAPSPVVAHL